MWLHIALLTFLIEANWTGLDSLAWRPALGETITRRCKAGVLVLGVLILGYHASLAASALSGIVVPAMQIQMTNYTLQNTPK
jgi:hypothetical protein